MKIKLEETIITIKEYDVIFYNNNVNEILHEVNNFTFGIRDGVFCCHDDDEITHEIHTNDCFVRSSTSFACWEFMTHDEYENFAQGKKVVKRDNDVLKSILNVIENDF